ncbi:TSSK6-activating co-chaperone protein [Mus caroli]|uniref:TSSK6-activating co-chaperone protein n=1 Tax=Mus caroli TaxID=10089 RepID=A0A6P5PIM9_MUSCR|nr:TSSK6-activating co-chaperone protein [Mus caroli]XP_021014424.1 TSSK6-activating co-chaperone protein [Mus caroli]
MEMEQHTSNATKEKAKEEDSVVCLCPAKSSPSYINLPANFTPANFLTIQTKLSSGAGQKPKECFGLLECMYANLQLQTQLAQRQIAILENLQASLSQLGSGRESKNCSLPGLCCKLLLNHLPQFHK